MGIAADPPTLPHPIPCTTPSCSTPTPARAAVKLANGQEVNVDDDPNAEQYSEIMLRYAPQTAQDTTQQQIKQGRVSIDLKKIKQRSK